MPRCVSARAVLGRTTYDHLNAVNRLSTAGAGADLAADNVPGKPLVVDIVESPLTGVPGRLTVPKLSMSIYELPLR